MSDSSDRKLKGPAAPPTAATYEGTKYPAAKFVIVLLALIGWIALVVGAFILLTALNTMTSRYGGFNILVIGPSAGLIVSGLVMIAAAELTRTSVDAADHARHTLRVNKEMLEIMKRQ